MDVCVPTCCLEDIKCLDILLRSLGAFADLVSCDLLVSHNSPNPHLHGMLTEVCRSHPTKSLSIDFFESEEAHGSQQHGEALNRLFAKTTSRHVMVFDPDVVITSPRWLGFCKRHIDGGCFIVGTPYEVPKLMWQGDFPNVWCAMIDGDALRAAGVDMRHLYCNNPAQASGDSNVGEPATNFYGQPIAGYLGGYWAFSRDTSWRMAAHGLRNRLKYVPFSLTDGLLPGLLRKWSAKAPTARMRRRARHAAYRLARLRALEFAFPGTDEVCCAHLLRAGGRPRRADGWILCANMVLDVCGAVPVSGSGTPTHPLIVPEPRRKKIRPKMTRQQRRSRRHK